MKIAYIYTLIQLGKESMGITNKINAQIMEFQRSGINVDLKLCYYISKSKRILPFQTNSADWFSMRKDLLNYDGLYIRFSTFDFQLLRTLKWIKRKNQKSKIVLEIPTYPYEEELNGRNRLIQFRDRLYRHFLTGKIDRIVTFSDDKVLFGIKTIITCNGVDIDRIKRHVHVRNDENRFDLCMVAAFERWHGADRLIKGLVDYYKSRNGSPDETANKLDVYLHMVGKGSDKLMNQLYTLAGDPLVAGRVKFYGYKKGAELDEIFDGCDMAVASLGLHRLNIKGASTLKTREYLGRGIPFAYSSVVFEFEKNPVDFAIQISTDENNVDINQLIDFYRGVINEYGDRLTEVIRDYGIEHVSLKKAMKPVEEYYMAE